MFYAVPTSVVISHKNQIWAYSVLGEIMFGLAQSWVIVSMTRVTLTEPGQQDIKTRRSFLAYLDFW